MKHTVETYEGITFFHTDQFIHVNRALESFKLPHHKHDFVEVAYVAQGQGVHYIADRVVKVSKGHICYIPIDTSHVFRPAAPDQPLIVYNCLFSKAILDQLKSVIGDRDIVSFIDQIKQNKLDFFIIQDRNEQFNHLYQQLLVHYQQQLPGSYDFIVSLFMQLIILLFRWQQQDDTKLSHPSYSFDDILYYVQQHFHEPLTLKQLSQLFNFSERQLQRYFLKYTSTSWLAYLQQLRIKQSQQLLSSSQYKIYYIATKVGYHDLTTFTQLFKQHTGMTPSQYRKKMQPLITE